MMLLEGKKEKLPLSPPRRSGWARKGVEERLFCPPAPKGEEKEKSLLFPYLRERQMGPGEKKARPEET